MGAHHGPDRRRPGGPGPSGGIGSCVGVDHPGGAPGPGPPGPRHSCEVMVVKPRVLWRLVYLVPVVAGCDCSWRSGAQATSCSAGVRIPMAECGRMVPVPVDPLGGGDRGWRGCPPKVPGQRMRSALYKELERLGQGKAERSRPSTPPRRLPRTRTGPAHREWTCTARRGRKWCTRPVRSAPARFRC